MHCRTSEKLRCYFLGEFTLAEFQGPLTELSLGGALGRRSSAALILRSFRSTFLRVQGRRRLELGIADPLVVADLGQEALVGHVAVIEARDGVGSHDALHFAVIVVNLSLDVAFPVGRVAPGVSFLHRQMIVSTDIQSDALIMRGHARDWVVRLFFSYGHARAQ